MWPGSSSITYSIASVCPDELSTIIDLNSSTKHFNGSVINSESKVCHQQHTIQLPTVMQKPSTRLLESYSRSLSQKVTRLGRQIRQIPISLPHNGENSDKGHAAFLGVWRWSCTSIGDSYHIPPSCLDNQDDRRREVSITPPRVRSFRRQISVSPIANRALSSPNY